MTLEHTYMPPQLNPLEAQLLNALLTRDWPRDFDFFGKQCSFKTDPWQAPFIPAYGLRLDVRGETWQVLFSSSSPMGLHPAGACIAQSPSLPEGLRLALFELSLAPVLTSLANFLGLDNPPDILTESHEVPNDFTCSVPLVLCLPGKDVAMTLYFPSQDSAEAVLHRLSQKKTIRNPVSALVVAVTLEAGAMRLTLPELLALRPEDILLPETYPGLEGELCLRLAPNMAIRCAIADGNATVLGFEHGAPRSAEKETRREEMADTLPNEKKAADSGTQVLDEHQARPEDGATAPELPINLDSLEVAVTFEVDRRLMSIAEIASLSPGYTFTLPVDPRGPVTIRANGKRLGAGRLVEVGGALGVQLISVEQE